MEFTPSVPIYSADEKFRTSLQSLVKSNRGRWKSDRQKGFLSRVLREWGGDPNRDVPFPVNPPEGTEYAVWFSMMSKMYGNRYHEIFWMDEDGVVGTNRVVEPTGVKSTERARRLGWVVKPGWRRDVADNASSFKEIIQNAEIGVVHQIPEGMDNPYAPSRRNSHRPYKAIPIGYDENGNRTRAIMYDDFGNFIMLDGSRKGRFKGYLGERMREGDNFAEHEDEIAESLSTRTDMEIYVEALSELPRMEIVPAPEEVLQMISSLPYISPSDLSPSTWATVIIDTSNDMVIFEAPAGEGKNIYTIARVVSEIVRNGGTLRENQNIIDATRLEYGRSSTRVQKFAQISFDTSAIASGVRPKMTKMAWEDFDLDDIFEDDLDNISKENEDFKRDLEFEKIKKKRQEKRLENNPEAVPFGVSQWDNVMKSRFLSDKINNLNMRWPPMPFGIGDLWGRLEKTKSMGNGIIIERTGYETMDPHKIKYVIWDKNGIVEGASIAATESPSPSAKILGVMTISNGRGEMMIDYDHGMDEPIFLPYQQKPDEE
jgi:hypothetical protein